MRIRRSFNEFSETDCINYNRKSIEVEWTKISKIVAQRAMHNVH